MWPYFPSLLSPHLLLWSVSFFVSSDSFFVGLCNPASNRELCIMEIAPSFINPPVTKSFPGLLYLPSFHSYGGQNLRKTQASCEKQQMKCFLLFLCLFSFYVALPSLLLPSPFPYLLSSASSNKAGKWCVSVTYGENFPERNVCH